MKAILDRDQTGPISGSVPVPAQNTAGSVLSRNIFLFCHRSTIMHMAAQASQAMCILLTHLLWLKCEFSKVLKNAT